MIYRPYQSNVNIMAENMLSVRISTREEFLFQLLTISNGWHLLIVNN